MRKMRLQSSSAWQTERSKKLHRACLCVKTATLRGEKVERAIQRVSRRYHGGRYKSDSTRQLALAPGTLRHLFDRWQRGGEVPAAFKLHYFSRPPYMPRPLLIRFVKFCADNRQASVKSAWAKFSRQIQNGRAREFSYGQVTYVFSAAAFYQMQAELKAAAKARARLDKIKFAAIANITNRLPLRSPHRRARREINFEI